MKTALMIILTGTLAVASTLTNNQFGQPETNCNYSSSAPYTTPTCPVIGSPAQFDIQSISVSVTGSTVTATIDFNYGGNSTLAPWTDGGIQLEPGDLFFYDPSDPNATKQYGVALDSSRPGSSDVFIAGDLYKIGGNIGVETAAAALGSPSAYYRVNQGVLMVDNAAGAPAVAGAGNGVHVAALGNGQTAADYAVTVQFTAPSALLNEFNSNNGSIGVAFAAADCGNAILDGVTPPNCAAPEPAGVTLMGIGIGIIGLANYWRKKSSTKA